jgi:hypothetical protein
VTRHKIIIAIELVARDGADIDSAIESALDAGVIQDPLVEWLATSGIKATLTKTSRERGNDGE